MNSLFLASQRDKHIVLKTRFLAVGRHLPEIAETLPGVWKRQPFMALNGGSQFQFNEAVSFVILCKDQQEIDHYWYKLIAKLFLPLDSMFMKISFYFFCFDDFGGFSQALFDEQMI